MGKKPWKCTDPGRVWVLCYHEHEVEVDQVCAAADADDAALQVGLRLPDGFKRRQDLGILRENRKEEKYSEKVQRKKGQVKVFVYAATGVKNLWYSKSLW